MDMKNGGGGGGGPTRATKINTKYVYWHDIHAAGSLHKERIDNVNWFPISYIFVRIKNKGKMTSSCDVVLGNRAFFFQKMDVLTTVCSLRLRRKQTRHQRFWLYYNA